MLFRINVIYDINSNCFPKQKIQKFSTNQKQKKIIHTEVRFRRFMLKYYWKICQIISNGKFSLFLFRIFCVYKEFPSFFFDCLQKYLGDRFLSLPSFFSKIKTR